jgi:hypothetical protein
MTGSELTSSAANTKPTVGNLLNLELSPLRDFISNSARFMSPTWEQTF